MNICVECKHYSVYGMDGLGVNFPTCPIGNTNPVTGEIIKRGNCNSRNSDGKCKDYEAKEQK